MCGFAALSPIESVDGLGVLVCIRTSSKVLTVDWQRGKGAHSRWAFFLQWGVEGSCTSDTKKDTHSHKWEGAKQHERRRSVTEWNDACVDRCHQEASIPNQVMAHLSRACLHLATAGREGSSPHVVYDILHELQTRGYTVELRWLHLQGTHPLGLALRVNGYIIDIIACMNANRIYDGTFLVQHGSYGVCLDAVRSIELPCEFSAVQEIEDDDNKLASFHLDKVLTSWVNQWPTRVDIQQERSIENYVSRLAGFPVKVVASRLEVYLSATLVADGVDALLSISSKLTQNL